MMEHGSGWVLQRYVARKYGISLAGESLINLIDPIAADELRQAAKGILQEWWLPMLEDTSLLDDDEYQAYAVLTMCRILYTIEKGDVASKPYVAKWAKDNLPSQWLPLIQQASVWRHGKVMNVLDDVVALLRYTLEQGQ
jgi:hypothetical protein